MSKHAAYTTFPAPISNPPHAAFDIHVYFRANDEAETEFAVELNERIKREFPDLRTYPPIHRPIGPHTRAMFEVNLFTPAQFGAIVPWLVVERGALSVLVHPNCVAASGDAEDVKDHAERGIWLGPKLELNLGILEELEARRKGAGS